MNGLNGFFRHRFSLFLSVLLVTTFIQAFSPTLIPKAAAATCAQGGVCAVGDRGPGGGIIFYVASTNFSSPGSVCNNACKYLEVAPSTWQSAGTTVANDPNYAFSSSSAVTGQNITTSSSESGRTGEKYNWKIGQGFYNTSVMRVSGATSQPQAAVLAYAGNVTAGEWFLPSANELNELCKYARGQATGVPTVLCSSSGTLKTTAVAGTDLGGFVASFYWSSTESSSPTSDAMNFNFNSAGFGGYTKSYAMAVRPIRAVSAPTPTSTTTSLSVQYSSRTYGASNSLQATISSNTATGTVNFMNNGVSILGCEAVAISSGIATCTTWLPSVGNYSNLTAVYSGSSSFGTSTSNAASLTVTAATLTITASSATVTYGATVPTISASYSGLLNGDSSSVVVGQTCTTTYTATSAVGTSPKTSCSGGTASNYSISYVDGSVTINKANPTFSPWSDVSKTYGNSPFLATAPVVAGSLAGTFAYSSATTSVISVSSSTFTVVGTGTSVITATFTPTDSTNYNSVTTSMTVTVGIATQTISRTSTSPISPVKSGTYTPTATASSSLAVVITIASGSSSVCSIAAGVVTFNSVGSCVIQYNQSGNSNYSAATQVIETLIIGKATPTFSSWNNVAKSFGDSQFTVTAPNVVGSLSGTFSYSSATTTVVSISGSTIAVVGTGTSVITATFTPTDSTNYNIATTTMTVTVGAGSQSITKTSTSPISPIVSGTYTPTATASSTLTVSITIASGSASICTIASGVVTFNSAGSCVIQYDQMGNSNYSAATQVIETLSIGKATPTFSSWSNVSKAFENNDFTLTAPTVTGSLPGTFTYSSATPTVISLNGNVATVAGAGTSVITATFTPTDSTTYNSATTTMTVTVAKVSPRFSTVDVSKTFGALPFSLSNPYVYRLLTGTFGFSSSDTSVITLSGRIATVVGVGTSVITATFTPDDTNNYLTGATTTFNVTVTQGAQTNALVINSTAVTYGSTLSLTTTGGSGSGSNSFAVDSGPCTVLGSTLTPTAAGTCMVTATKAASGNYLAASSVSTAITVNPKGLTVSGLTGVNKEFDRGLSASATGTPTLVGKVGSDDVLLGGTPVFTFASSNVATGITITASGYTLTGTTASNYTLTQPTITANITAKAARVSATNTTIAYGATVTSGFTTSGLISPDAVSSASYTYTGTGTSTPPTAVGVYTVTPSNAVFSTGLLGNYTITYDTATVTILAKYTITYNANGGVVASSSTSSVDYVVGETALTLPTPTRANYTFTGWYTLQSNGIQITGIYTPTATATLWARWVQNSLYGMGLNTKILTITTLANAGNTYSVSAGDGTVSIEYVANALPVGTVIDGYLLSDTSTATSVIGSGNDYVMSLVLAWVATDGTVPTTAAGKAISMTIANSVIKKGAKIYSVIGTTPTLLGTAAADGSAVISITDDPQIIIAITKPDAPTGVSATSGGNASTTVSWTAPSDGGSAITSYTATSNAGQTCSSSTTSCSITGLTNGTPYTFTVTATNLIGTSDPSSASSAATPAAPVVTPPSSGGGGGGSTYVAPNPAPTPTVDPAVAAAAAAKALADAKAAEEKAAAEAKALAEKKAAEEAALLATIKALQDKADADSLAAAKKLAEELAAAQFKAEEELKAAVALKLAEEQRIAAERSAAAKKITTVYSLTSAFKLNTTYTKRLNSYTKKIATGSTVTCIGYAKSSKTLSYAKAKVVATMQAKALCSSMKKINPTLITKSIVYPASKTPVTTVNKKWIPVSYRIEIPVN